MHELWHFFAGLGLFLYGISTLESALKNLGGKKFVEFLRSHTKNPVESIGSGTILTALLQSSSLVSLMVLAFVGSRYIPMSNALGIIMGANLGTTFTGWIVAIFGFKLDIENYALPIVAIGSLGLVFILSKSKTRYIFMAVFGFGLLVFGLGFMKNGMESIINIIDINSYKDYSIIFFFIFGMVVTAIIQSSSAMMAIVLSALSLESVTLSQAAATVIGADLGSTVTVVLASLSGATAKKQVATFHVIFNLIVDLLALLMLPIILIFIVEYIHITDPLFALVSFHNIFNAAGIVLFLPFLKYISKLINQIFNVRHHHVARYIHDVDYKIPAMPLDSLNKEILHMISQVIKFNMQVIGIKHQMQTSIMNSMGTYITYHMPLKERYELIKNLESEIICYTSTLIKQPLSDKQRERLILWTASARNLVHSARSMKSIKSDIAYLIRVDDLNSYKNSETLTLSSTVLYEEVVSLLTINKNQNQIERLARMDLLNEKTHDDLVKYIYSNYSTKASTPLNVVREIYSSNKALIHSIREYLLNESTLRTLDDFPGLVR